MAKRRVTYDAAGGIVLNQENHVLVLHRTRNNEVRLPKGHVEARELLEDAAKREIQEESGYADINLITSLGTQIVEFDLADKHQHIVRQEFYFLFRLRSELQVERDAHDLQFKPSWMPIQTALEILTFEAEREFLRRAQVWLEKGDEGLLHL